jgi:hypothetical protein
LGFGLGLGRAHDQRQVRQGQGPARHAPGIAVQLIQRRVCRDQATLRINPAMDDLHAAALGGAG